MIFRFRQVSSDNEFKINTQEVSDKLCGPIGNLAIGPHSIRVINQLRWLNCPFNLLGCFLEAEGLINLGLTGLKRLKDVLYRLHGNLVFLHINEFEKIKRRIVPS